ncbi:MAG: trimethylamine methyltransferase family protein [Myxococcales bacterium]|nr:trimethylamine methyltransferase family protein [Myxococcales bacterium]MDH5307665.1 trimethylamine methyltransferase family protein [Myxococcales bacterium]MDH5567261.1 trimethylamine methyltransferase family protein [Myxococcales bacterium]
MKTLLQVLSQEERAQVHERTLRILAGTGVRVDSAQGRKILGDAGAELDEAARRVRLPRDLVEASLRCAPRTFTLGARRPDFDLHMNAGDCVLLADGEATCLLDGVSGKLRPAGFADWLEATRLIDALDEVGVYWSMVAGGLGDGSQADLVKYWRHLFANFSKHIQDSTSRAAQAPWLLEVMQVVFGDREAIRRRRPLSFVLCPQSPLILDETYTDAYLALLGWEIPVAVMPMPLMGSTAPANLIATTLLGNCEVLAMLCLVQAAAPGTPFVYAPCLARMNPRSGGYGGGAIEQGLLAAAATEMARYYDLPAQAAGIVTDHYVPGIQASYERALNGLLPTLAWPDILVGPGVLGGATVLSLEQLLLDVEVFRSCKRARRGIATDAGAWLEDVIQRVGPGGHFLLEDSTLEAIRGNPAQPGEEPEWYISELGVHTTLEQWQAAGEPSLLDEVHRQVVETLATHEPLPLAPEAERELDRIQKRCAETAQR